jgi:hypothetical protein
MLLDAAVLTIIVGVIAGGRLGRLKDLDLRAPAAFIAAAVAQVALLALSASGVAMPPALGPGLYMVSFVLLLGGLWLNRHLPGVRLVGLGAFLNLLVIAANGGSMPVDRGLAERAGSERLVELLDSPEYTMHEPVTEATRLRPLADVLPLPMLVPRPRFYSPGSVGDILVTIGACWLVLHAVGAFGLRGKGQRAPGEEG